MNIDDPSSLSSLARNNNGVETTTTDVTMTNNVNPSTVMNNTFHPPQETASDIPGPPPPQSLVDSGPTAPSRPSRRRSSSAQIPDEKRTRGESGSMQQVISYQAGGEEKRKRNPEFLNTVPRFYQLNNELLLAEVWEALHKAQAAWLTARDVLALLEFCKDMQLGARAPVRPPSGTVFYFDSRAGEYFRRDGYDYIKKKGSGISVREDHVKLRQGAVAVIYASYVHSAEWIDEVSGASMFHRRSYWLVNSDEKDRGVIVHYLGNPASQIDPVVRPHEAICDCLLCCIKRENSRPDRPGESLEQILSRAEGLVKLKKKRNPALFTSAAMPSSS